MPLTLTVDLAGDDPVPVLGTILDPQADDADLTSSVRQFELLTSLDGSTYDVVLSGELSPLDSDQAFVLDAPVMARYAQLRVLSDARSNQCTRRARGVEGDRRAW